MPALVTFTKSLIAASAVVIAASQTPGAAGALTLVGGGMVTLDTQRRVLITCVGNNSARIFTLTGTRDTGQVVTETMVGPNATTGQSLNDYRTITAISIDGASTGAVTVGTSAVGSSDWKLIDTHAKPFAMTIAFTVTGTVTYGLELTNSRILVVPTLFAAAPINIIPTTIAAATANTLYNFAAPAHAWRLTVTAGTGSVAADAAQSG
jgi:hypothetical protein